MRNADQSPCDCRPPHAGLARLLAAVCQALAIVVLVAGLMAWPWFDDPMFAATGGAGFFALTWASGILDRAGRSPGKAPDAEE